MSVISIDSNLGATGVQIEPSKAGDIINAASKIGGAVGVFFGGVGGPVGSVLGSIIGGLASAFGLGENSTPITLATRSIIAESFGYVLGPDRVFLGPSGAPHVRGVIDEQKAEESVRNLMLLMRDSIGIKYYADLTLAIATLRLRSGSSSIPAAESALVYINQDPLIDNEDVNILPGISAGAAAIAIGLAIIAFRG